MKITYQNKQLEVNQGSRVVDIFKEEIDNSKTPILACKINNEVKSLNEKLEENDVLEFVDLSQRDGGRIYSRGLLFIMAKAFEELYPKLHLNINHQISNDIFCDICNTIPDEEMIKKLQKRMQEIINQNLEIKKVEMSKEEAEKLLKKDPTDTSIKLQLEIKEKNYVSLYFCGEYYNYFYGIMPPSTGYIKNFELMKYQDGFFVRYPTRNSPNIIEEFKDSKKLYATMKDYEDIFRAIGVTTLDKMNQTIRKGKGKELVLIAEALHEKKISQIADLIAQDKNKKMILIAGPSSSGKTTFAKRLGIQLRLNGLKPKTISVDNYFVEREDTPRDEDGKYDFEALEAIDLELLNRDIKALLEGKEIELPTFDFKDGHKYYKGDKMKLADDEVLIMEGIHCLNDKLTPLIPQNQKFKIYISALTVLNIDYYNRITTTDTRIIRRTVRDHNFRGYSANDTLASWHSVSRGEEKNIFPFQEQADVMFNSSLIYEINALKNYALPLFEKITNDSPEYAEAKRLTRFLKYFEPLEIDDIPRNSLLREFLGDSIFKY